MNIFWWLSLLVVAVSQPEADTASTSLRASFTRLEIPKAQPLFEAPIAHLMDSVVLLQNRDSLLPFQQLLDRSFHIFQFSDIQYATFDYYFRQYADAVSYANISQEKLTLLADSVATEQSVFVVLLDRTVTSHFNYFSIALAINKIAESRPTVVVNFSDVRYLETFHKDVVLLQMPMRTLYSEAIAAQLLFGGLDLVGTLSDQISVDLPKGAGDYMRATRLAHTTPESVGIDSERLLKIDELAADGIAMGAFPGAQVLVAKDGKIIYDKAFGHHSYVGFEEVQRTDLYDLASLTKVAATTLATMQLYEEEQLSLNAPIRSYIPGRSSLHYTRIRHLLTHTSGFQSYLPIAKYIYHGRDEGINCDTLFCTRPLSPYTVKVADGVYLNEHAKEDIWNSIFRLRPNRRRNYRYSDVNFVLLQKVVEEVSGTDLETFVNESFYQPLGLRYLLFNPLQRFDMQQITPTVLDTTWRRQLLRGNVHDEGAALLGGVAGNAGLFSNAQDLAIIFQMLLNGGEYGNRRYFSEATVDKFTSRYPKTKRALGFDMRTSRKKYLPYARSASVETFGHTGFTGTCVWADPEHDLIFVLLTNRVHPDKNNKRLARYDLRSKMHQVVYDALNTATVLE